MVSMRWSRVALAWIKGILLLALMLGVVSCAQGPDKPAKQVSLQSDQRANSPVEQTGDRQSDRRHARPLRTKSIEPIVEVSPPGGIQDVRSIMDQYRPQVKILSPSPGALIEDDTIMVQLEVKGMPVFQDAELGLGPHLHLYVDNDPYQAIYALGHPIVLTDLTPGTHMLRVVASYPWYESFKNEGAYAQLTFHVFTQTQDHAPDPSLPLLTYGMPQGEYGAEPLLLDFDVMDGLKAPDPAHDLEPVQGAKAVTPNWQVKVTVNDASFQMSEGKPIYLTGFKTGKNWVRLTLLDQQGEPIPNVFNDVVRVITVNPGEQDSLAQLVRGELAPDAMAAIVDPNYTPPPPEAPEPESASAPMTDPTSDLKTPDKAVLAPDAEATLQSNPVDSGAQPPESQNDDAGPSMAPLDSGISAETGGDAGSIPVPLAPHAEQAESDSTAPNPSGPPSTAANPEAAPEGPPDEAGAQLTP